VLWFLLIFLKKIVDSIFTPRESLAHTDLPDRFSYYVGEGNSGEAGSLDVGLLSGRVVDLTLQIFVV
jgi:hypothetical protein